IHSSTDPCYYDLSYTQKTIKGDGNIIVRIAGNEIKQILKTKKGEMVTLYPVGLTLSIPLSHFSSALFQQGKPIHIQMCKGKNSSIDLKGTVV
ncbi:MAG: hypothetical protein EBU18_12425, partial [Rhodobacteraceae bacterium]|nr:hypothetical protein [Paracoccaceae bacterium]